MNPGTSSNIQSEQVKDKLVRECEQNVISALKHNPLVRLLLEALADSGCKVIPHRHLVIFFEAFHSFLENCIAKSQRKLMQLGVLH